MTFNKLNLILASMIFLGVVSSLCAVTTINIYQENNLGFHITKFIDDNNK